MPDGEMRGDPGRVVGLFGASDTECPSCGHRHEMTVGDGAALVTCTFRRRGKVCGQKAAVLAIGSRASMVVPISQAEFEELTQAGPNTSVILGRLGLLGIALTTAA